MPITNLLKLQLLYTLLGIGFNIISLIIINQGGSSLTPNDPKAGLVVMGTYGLLLLFGYFKKYNLYRILMFLALILLGYGGVLNHLIQSPIYGEGYHSFGVGLLGTGINVFGFILNLIAVLGKFKTD